MDDNTRNEPTQPVTQAPFGPTQPLTGPPITTPAPEQPMAPPVMPVMPEKKKSKIGLIIAIVLVVILAGLAGGYFWYQNPDKVLSDVMAKTLTAKTVSFKIKASDGVNLSADSMAMLPVKLSGIDISLSADLETSAASLNGNIYLDMAGSDVKLDGRFIIASEKEMFFYVDGVADAIVGLVGDSVDDPNADTIIKSVTGNLEKKWVKLNIDDLKGEDDNNDGTQALTCVTDKLKSIRSDKTFATQIKKAYNENKYLKIKETSRQDGDFVFLVDVDQAKSESYGKALAETDLMKQLQDCIKSDAEDEDEDDFFSDDTLDDASDDMSDALSQINNVEIRVGQWNHQLKSITAEIEYKSDNSESATKTSPVKVEALFDSGVDITAPADSVDFKEWSEDLSGLILLFMGGLDMDQSLPFDISDSSLSF